MRHVHCICSKNLNGSEHHQDATCSDAHPQANDVIFSSFPPSLLLPNCPPRPQRLTKGFFINSLLLDLECDSEDVSDMGLWSDWWSAREECQCLPKVPKVHILNFWVDFFLPIPVSLIFMFPWPWFIILLIQTCSRFTSNVKAWAIH